MRNCDVTNVLLFTGGHIPEDVCFSSEIPAEFLDTIYSKTKTRKQKQKEGDLIMRVSLSLFLILIKGREIDPLHYNVPPNLASSLVYIHQYIQYIHKTDRQTDRHTYLMTSFRSMG